MASDNVHYLSDGYANLVENCTAALQVRGAAETVTKPSNKASQFFWRGFRSPIGAKMTAMMPGARGMGSARGRPEKSSTHIAEINCDRTVFVSSLPPSQSARFLITFAIRPLLSINVQFNAVCYTTAIRYYVFRFAFPKCRVLIF
jgi:hypothetical protein